MSSVMVESVGERVRARRVELGWTQTELADLLGITQSMVSMVETGERQLAPTLLVRAARALRLRVRDLSPPGSDMEEGPP